MEKLTAWYTLAKEFTISLCWCELVGLKQKIK